MFLWSICWPRTSPISLIYLILDNKRFKIRFNLIEPISGVAMVTFFFQLSNLELVLPLARMMRSQFQTST